MNKYAERPVTIFWDNARIHISAKVKEFCSDINLIVIANATYRPDLNGIEHVWQRAKLHFRSRVDWHKANFESWN